MTFKKFIKDMITPKTNEEITKEIERQELLQKLAEAKQKTRKAKK